MLFQYESLVGHEYDTGLVRADNIQQAKNFLAIRLKKTLESDEIELRFRTINDTNTNGILEFFDGYIDLTFKR